MTKNQTEYLAHLGLIRGRDRKSADHLLIALRVLREGYVGMNRAHNRHTGSVETPVGLIAREIGHTNAYVSQELGMWQERFLLAYDDKDPVFVGICPPKIAKILTPTQLIYLISLDFPDFR